MCQQVHMCVTVSQHIRSQYLSCYNSGSVCKSWESLLKLFYHLMPNIKNTQSFPRKMSQNIPSTYNSARNLKDEFLPLGKIYHQVNRCVSVNLNSSVISAWTRYARCPWYVSRLWFDFSPHVTDRIKTISWKSVNLICD